MYNSACWNRFPDAIPICLFCYFPLLIALTLHHYLGGELHGVWSSLAALACCRNQRVAKATNNSTGGRHVQNSLVEKVRNAAFIHKLHQQVL